MGSARTFTGCVIAISLFGCQQVDNKTATLVAGVTSVVTSLTPTNCAVEPAA